MRRLACAAICFLVLCGCRDEETDVAHLIRQLSSTEYDQSERMPIAQVAAYRLGELRDRSAAPALVECLRTHPDGMVRGAAVQALGRMQSVDAFPTVIDAMLDLYGALRETDFALVQISDNNLRLPGPANRATIIAWQRELRKWWKKYEGKLREHRAQPGPSKITDAAAAPPHDPTATMEKVAGTYMTRRWGDIVLLRLRKDGSFGLRARNPDANLAWPREEGTWAVGEQGVELMWKFNGDDSLPPWERARKTTPSAVATMTTVAAWAKDEIHMYPECRAPFDLALKRARQQDLDKLDPSLKFVDADIVVGKWTTRTESPNVELTLDADGTFTQIFDRGEHKGLVERAAGTRTGAWTWVELGRKVVLTGKKLLRPDGTPSQYAPGSETLVLDGDVLKASAYGVEEVLHREPKGSGNR